jgi:thioredoxin 1
MSDLTLRLFLALALIAVGYIVCCGWNRWQLWRLSDARRSPGLEGWQAGVPGILYFTTPECAPCRTMQRPALERLRAEWPDEVQVIEIDASAAMPVADHWGVLSVPTTFVLDGRGQPHHVNHGVAGLEKLKRQLSDVARRATPSLSAAAG